MVVRQAVRVAGSITRGKSRLMVRCLALLFLAVSGGIGQFKATPDLIAQDSNKQNSGNTVVGGTSNETGSAPENKNGLTDGKSSLNDLPTAVRYLPNKAGELVPVVSNATLEAYLEFLNNPPAEGNGKKEQPPAATVSSIELTGEADEDRVRLEAKFIIHLRQPDEYVRVPLYLNEAVILKQRYTGKGTEMFHAKDRDQGNIWWFRGVGPHQLDLTLSIPLRKQLPTRRVQLSLPNSPVARLNLTVPHRTNSVQMLPNPVPLELKSLDGGKTAIEAFGLGNRLDLSWLPSTDASNVEAALEANTTILVQVDADTVLLEVQQRIQALQGTFDNFTVQLPLGAEILKIEGDDYADHRIDPNTSGRVTVLLKKGTAGPVRTSWTVRMPGGERRRMTLGGFVVDKARKQSGEIGLVPQDGLRLSTIPRKDANILRMDAAAMRTVSGAAQVTRAYRFLNQPFQLEIEVEKNKPYFLVEPKLIVSAATSQISLEALFPYQVYRDSLADVAFDWPGWKQDGWLLEGIDPSDIVDTSSLEEGPDSIRARLVKRQTGSFQIRLRARKIAKGSDEVSFQLPHVTASSTVTPTVVVVNAENVETELGTRGETVIRSVPPNALDQSGWPESLRNGLDPQRTPKWTAHRIDTEEQSFSLRIIPQSRRLRTETSCDATWQTDTIRIVQSITCDVAYERMTQLKLLVPRQIPQERIRFFADRDVELIDEWTETSDPDLRLVRLTLPDPKLGRFAVEARYFVTVDENLPLETGAFLSIPLLRCQDEAFALSRFRLGRVETLEASATEEVWKPLPLRPDEWAWSADGSRTDFPLKVRRSRAASTGTASVTMGLISAHVHATGQGTAMNDPMRAAVRGQFRMLVRTSSLNLVLPREAQLAALYWDGAQLAVGSDVVESPAGSRKFVIRIPETEQNPRDEPRDHLLTMDYHVPCGRQYGWSNSLQLPAPQLPDCSWVAQVVWQTTLPSDRHLLTYPSAAAPMFRWRRRGPFWYRISHPASAQLKQWIGAATGPKSSGTEELAVNDTAGNVYSFSQFGAPQTLAFHAISRSMVVLVGAGSSLIAGFLFLRVAMLRHVLTLLLAGLLLAAFGLWYSAPLELLLQPMIVGLVCPAIALSIENWYRRSYGPAVLSLPSAADLMSAHSRRSELYLPPNAMEETTLRGPGGGTSGSGYEASRTESGSGVS